MAAPAPRLIAHLDMDAFYASVEERENPALVGQAVIVGGSPASRGVVSAANYRAREFGVHSAMPTAAAARLCPRGVFLPPRMALYASVSRQIRAIFERYTPLVEPLSLDEAFLDVSGSERLFGDAESIGRRIQQQIRDELRLTASVGVAPNKFLAKLASDLEKPHGFVVVTRDDLHAFLDPLPVGRLWGVGRGAASALARLGVRSIGDLRRLPVEALVARLGSAGEHFWQLAHGRDHRRVMPDREAKSVSHETTFPIDVRDDEVLCAWLAESADQVGRRLRRNGLRARTVQLRLRFHDFKTITRSRSLAEATHATQTLSRTAVELFRLQTPRPLPPVRLVGLGVSGIGRTGERQGALFDQDQCDRQGRIDAVRDEIRDRFGVDALRVATGWIARAPNARESRTQRPLP